MKQGSMLRSVWLGLAALAAGCGEENGVEIVPFGSGSGGGNPVLISVGFDALTADGPVAWEAAEVAVSGLTFIPAVELESRSGWDGCAAEGIAFGLGEAERFPFLDGGGRRLVGGFEGRRRFCGLVLHPVVDQAGDIIPPALLLAGRRHSDGAPVRVMLVLRNGVRLRFGGSGLDLGSDAGAAWVLGLDLRSLLDGTDPERWNAAADGIIRVGMGWNAGVALRLKANLAGRLFLAPDEDGSGAVPFDIWDDPGLRDGEIDLTGEEAKG